MKEILRVATWGKAGRMRCPRDSPNCPFPSSMVSSVLQVGNVWLTFCWISGQGGGEAESLLFMNVVQTLEDCCLEGTFSCWPVLYVDISQCGSLQYISGNIKYLY